MTVYNKINELEKLKESDTTNQRFREQNVLYDAVVGSGVFVERVQDSQYLLLHSSIFLIFLEDILICNSDLEGHGTRKDSF